MKAMRLCYEHLRPGGTFVFDYQARWNDPPAWMSRLSDGRKALPQEWPAAADRRRLEDGSELEIVARTAATDPLEEISIR